ncbi:MAG: carbon-nitrogen hydrolase family protein [Phycisphaerales bacterium JB038]
MNGWPALQALACLSAFALTAGCAPTASEPTDTPRAVRIAVCQTFCIDSDIEGNLQRIDLALHEAAAQEADMATFPETALIGWVNPAAHELATPIPGALSDRIGELARRYEMMIAIGLCEKAGDRLHDSAILVDRDGALLLKHRKINILTELMDPPYTPGSRADIAAVDTRFGRIGMLICADTFVEENVKALAALEPDVVLVPYGWAAPVNAWPQHGESLAAWVSHVARTTRAPVVGTDLVGMISTGPWQGMTYGGQSPVADATGEIIATLRDRDAEVRVIEVLLGS